MENEKSPQDPDAVKLKAWLMTERRNEPTPDLNAEVSKMSGSIWRDWVAQFKFALKATAVGTVIGGACAVFFAYPLWLFMGAGAAVVGCVAYVFWVPSSRN